jgi:hypothetical protein
MPSTYTTRNRAEKQAPGENNNSWGSLLNGNMIDMFDQALDGMASYTLSGSKTLSTANGSSDEARCRYQNITGGTGGTVTIPNVEKSYIVRNNSTGAVTFTTGSGTSCSVAAKTAAIVICEGGNVCRTFTLSGISTLNIPFDGGGAPIAVGTEVDVRIDFDCVILAASGFGANGAFVCDIWKDSFANYPPTDADSITSLTPPGYLFGTNRGEDSTLSGWSTTIAAGSVLRFHVDISNVNYATVALKLARAN